MYSELREQFLTGSGAAKGEAARELAKLGALDIETLPKFVNALRDENDFVRHSVAWALTQFGPRLDEIACPAMHAFRKPKEFLIAYTGRIVSEHSLHFDLIRQLSDMIDAFGEAEAKTAALLLLRQVLSGKEVSGNFSRLKQATQGVAGELLAVVRPDGSFPWTDREIGEFIAESAPRHLPAVPPPSPPPPSRPITLVGGALPRPSAAAPEKPRGAVMPPPVSRPKPAVKKAKKLDVAKAEPKPEEFAKKIAVPEPEKKKPDKITREAAVDLKQALPVEKKTKFKAEETRKEELKAKEKLRRDEDLLDRTRMEEERVSTRRAARERAVPEAAATVPAPATGKKEVPTEVMPLPEDRRARIPLAKEVPSEAMPLRKKARRSPFIALLTLPFKILALPLVGAFYLVRGLYRGVRGLLWKARERLVQKAREAGMPVFELFLSEDCGRPGPVERLAAQSVLLMRAIQATLGLKFILLANAVDSVLEAITGYLQGIFQTWKMMGAVRRRIERERSRTQVRGVAEDLALGRVGLSRMLGLCGFYLEECSLSLPDSSAWHKVTHPSFPLKLALEIRGHLDEMKRDLDFVTSGQVRQLVGRSVGDFLWSFIPNPLNIIIPWKDLLLLAFAMKYSRREIEEMYVSFVHSYHETVSLLEEKYRGELGADYGEGLTSYQRDLFDHEQKMLQRIQKRDIFQDGGRLEEYIDRDKSHLQRLLRALSNPGQFIDPRRWYRADLLAEVKTMKDMQRVHPQNVLELERWLTREVERALREQGYAADTEEREARFREAKDFRRRYRLQRKLSRQFLL